MADQDPIAEATRTGPGWRFWLTLIAIVAAIVFVAQNSQEVEVTFFLSTTTAPLIFALLVAIGLGVVIGLLLPHLRARRSKQGD